MANLYVRSTDGSDADNGTTWALAKATLNGAAAIDAAGDTIYLSQAHAESTTTSPTIAFAGTLASPTKVICGNDAAEPPTAVSAAATCTYTSGGTPTINGNAYIRGITFSTDTGYLNLNQTASGVQFYDSCTFKITGASTRYIYIGTTASGLFKTIWQNCSISFNAATQRLYPVGDFVWSGGAVIDGGTDPTALVLIAGSAGRGCKILVESVDMSACATGVNIFDTTSPAGVDAFAVIRNCKLPASWSGSLVSPAISAPGMRVEMYNCDATDTNYRMWVEDYAGYIRSETIAVRTGGTSDGATKLAWKMVSVANAEYPLLSLSSPEIVRAYPGTAAEDAAWSAGATKTITIEFVHFAAGAGTNGALQNDEVWLELQYLGTNGYPLSILKSGAKADVLATAASHTTTSESWDSMATAYSAATNYAVGDIVKPTVANGAIYYLTTDAGTTAVEPTWGTTDGGTTTDAAGRVWTRSNRQKFSVDITPYEKGFIHAIVKLAKASTTVYVDPLLTVT